MDCEIFDYYKLTGSSHKILGVEEIIEDALRQGAEAIGVISSGNFAEAIMWGIRQRGLEDELVLVNLVNTDIEGDWTELPIDQQRILATPAEREKYIQENLGLHAVDYTDFIPQALTALGHTMLQSDPDYIVVPVGTGKNLLAIHQAIQQEGKNTKLVGVVPEGENGIYNDHLLQQTAIGLCYRDYNPSSIATKLSAPFISKKQQVLDAATVVEVTEAQLQKAHDCALRDARISEPSGSAAFCYFDPAFREKAGIPEYAKALLVNTGIGKYEQRVQWPKRWRAKLQRGTAGIGAGLALLATLYGGMVQKNMYLADINGDGMVSSHERQELRFMAAASQGPFSQVYEHITGEPFISLGSLNWMQQSRARLEKEIIGKYGSYEKARRNLIGVPENVDDVPHLSLQYLSALYDKMNNVNPEIFAGINRRILRDSELVATSLKAESRQPQSM